VFLDSLRHVSIGPVDLDIFRLTFMQPRPFLIAEDRKIQRIKLHQARICRRPFCDEAFLLSFHCLDVLIIAARTTR
jgi:hypothetical protein